MPDKTTDIKYMQIALSLARRMVGQTAPNPVVACVIVKDGQIISFSITDKGGRPHAETIALTKAGSNAKGATAYVTLEPCCHTGKTPPCSKALIDAGLARIVIATGDPFPKVSGGGIKQLKNAGIEVTQGVCEDEAKKLNAGFLTVQLKNRPYITLKLAISADGQISKTPNKSTVITGEIAHGYSHHLRATNDAIMVGVNTVAIDNPQLNCRLPGMEKQSPVRIVMDGNLRIAGDCKLVAEAKNNPLWIMTSTSCKDKASLKKNGIKIINCQTDDNSHIDLHDALGKLAENGITRLLVEGGSKLATSFIKNNLADEILLIKSPYTIGSKGVPALNNIDINSLEKNTDYRKISTRNLGRDVVECYIIVV